MSQTNLDFENVIKEMDDALVDATMGLKIEENLEKAYKYQEQMLVYNPETDKSEERTKAFKKINRFIELNAGSVAARFPAGSRLDGDAAEAVLRVRNLVKNMAFTQDAEETVRDEINKLYVNARRKYIAKDHEVMKNLWSQYYTKKGDNFINYLISSDRNEKRVQGILTTIKNEKENYNAQQFDKIMTLATSPVPKS